MRSAVWPKAPHVLSGRLRKAAPALRKVGINIDYGRVAEERWVKIIRSGGPSDPTTRPINGDPDPDSDADDAAEMRASHSNPTKTKDNDACDASDATAFFYENEEEGIEEYEECIEEECTHRYPVREGKEASRAPQATSPNKLNGFRIDARKKLSTAASSPSVKIDVAALFATTYRREDDGHWRPIRPATHADLDQYRRFALAFLDHFQYSSMHAPSRGRSRRLDEPCSGRAYQACLRLRPSRLARTPASVLGPDAGSPAGSPRPVQPPSADTSRSLGGAYPGRRPLHRACRGVERLAATEPCRAAAAPVGAAGQSPRSGRPHAVAAAIHRALASTAGAHSR